MWRYQKTDELYHHGILGMKWGVRRYQNKDGTLTNAGKIQYQKVSRKEYNKEYRDLKDNYIKKDPRTKQANDLAKKAYAYAKKHKLDFDDGGRGSVKAGQHYMSMWEKHEKLTNSVYKDATRKTNQQLKSKYGEKRIKQIEKENNVLAIGALAGVTVGTFATINLTKKGIKAAGRGIAKVGKMSIDAIKRR